MTRRLTALLAMAIAAAALAGCGGGDERTIPHDQGATLIRLLRQARDQAGDQDKCDALARTVSSLQVRVQELGPGVDKDTRVSLVDGVNNLADKARTECENAQTETTTPPTQTTPPPTTQTTPPPSTQTTPPPTTQTTPPPTNPGGEEGGKKGEEGKGNGNGNGNGNSTGGAAPAGKKKKPKGKGK